VETDEEREDRPGELDEAGRPRGPLSRFGALAERDEPEREDARQGGDALERGLRGDIAARVRVDDQGVHRPFMLGTLVHTLTESGLSFEDAYRVAREIWLRVRDRKVVTTKELSELVEDLGTAASGGRFEPTELGMNDGLKVIGPDGRWPFNQGRIQQSLLAAALEPRQAFEAAVEIERELRQRGERTVTRDAIRGLASEILGRRFGEGYAARYRAWRDFQSGDERPVVVLLGGTSGVGKSTLAIEVARRLTIARLLSTDSIRDVMRVMLSDDLVPTLHVSSFEAHTRLVTEVREGLDPIIEGFLDQSRTVAVGVRAVIERAVKEGTSTVLDGVSLVPGLFDLEGWGDRAHVFFLLAADVDRESLHGHLMARAHGKGARASERYVRNFKEIFRIQEDLLERAEAFGIPVVDVQDTEVAAEQVVAHVVGRLGERRAAERARG
jgi:2-phosphoglycerate kinase